MQALSYHFCHLAMPPLTFPEAILSYDWQERLFLVGWICSPLVYCHDTLASSNFSPRISFSAFKNVHTMKGVLWSEAYAQNWSINELKTGTSYWQGNGANNLCELQIQISGRCKKTLQFGEQLSQKKKSSYSCQKTSSEIPRHVYFIKENLDVKQ